MIISMTGFANAESTFNNNITQSIEIRSINSKFLDLSIKLPKCYSNYENDIRDIFRNKISRGKVIVQISRKKNGEPEIPLEINKDSIKYLKNLFTTLKKEAKLKEKIKLEHYLKFAEVFTVKDDADEVEISSVKNLCEKAIDILMKMKKEEGDELRKDIEKRIDNCHKMVIQIEAIWSKTSNDEIKRLKEKVKSLIEDSNFDQNRMELEIALLLDKMDITEECVRFKSHVKFFKESAKSKEAAGKKLTFLSQELLREANTIASKSNSAEISQKVVIIKEEIEKIKEQLQNIE